MLTIQERGAAQRLGLLVGLLLCLLSQLEYSLPFQSHPLVFLSSLQNFPPPGYFAFAAIYIGHLFKIYPASISLHQRVVLPSLPRVEGLNIIIKNLPFLLWVGENVLSDSKYKTTEVMQLRLRQRSLPQLLEQLGSESPFSRSLNRDAVIAPWIHGVGYTILFLKVIEDLNRDL